MFRFGQCLGMTKGYQKCLVELTGFYYALWMKSHVPDCVWADKNQSGHCYTHSGTTAGMLAEPFRSLCAFYEETNSNHILLNILFEMKD